MDGVSMAYTFPKEAVATPSTRRTQYFEILGNRAIYHAGWMASTTPAAPPWNGMAPRPTDTMNGWKWELYNLAADPTQVNDLAAAEPARLRGLQDLFIMEAARNQVFPLNSSITAMINPRPGPAAGLDRFVYTAPVSAIQGNAAPNILNRSFTITAEIEVPQDEANGVLVTQGGRFSGWGLYLVQGKPVFTMNLLNLERVRWAGPDSLPPGRHTVVFDFALEPKGPIPFGHGGVGVLSVNGRKLAEHTLPKTLPFTFAWDETFDVGLDTGTPVDDLDYQVPFAFTGKLGRITINLGPTTATPAAFRAFMEEMARRTR
jgi:arylsulfatase